VRGTIHNHTQNSWTSQLSLHSELDGIKLLVHVISLDLEISVPSYNLVDSQEDIIAISISASTHSRSRSYILHNMSNVASSSRLDGRQPLDFRPLHASINHLDRADGSGKFGFGKCVARMISVGTPLARAVPTLYDHPHRPP
jgi:hypothetical protein